MMWGNVSQKDVVPIQILSPCALSKEQMTPAEKDQIWSHLLVVSRGPELDLRLHFGGLRPARHDSTRARSGGGHRGNTVDD